MPPTSSLSVILCSETRGGCEEYALTMARALKSRFSRVTAAFPYRKSSESLVCDFTSAGIQYLPLAISERGAISSRTAAAHYRRFRRTLDLLVAERPEACLFVTPSIQYMMGPLAAAASLKIPSLVCFQYVQNHYQFKPHELGTYRRIRRTQSWIAVSEQNRRLLASSFHLKVDDLHVVQNGVNVDRFQSSPSLRRECRAALRRELKLASDAFLFLTVGAIRPQKGYDLVAPAFQRVAQQHPRAHWIWVGEGPDREVFLRQIADGGLAGRVHLVGRRSDIPQLLFGADSFVFPSRYEGQPFALLEAMAAELPVLTSDASGITEVATDQVNSLVFPSGDATILALLLARAIEQPDYVMTLARQAVVRVQDFSERRMVREALAILEQLRERHHGPTAVAPLYRTD